MENRPLDQLMQNQMKEENQPHSRNNCLFFYLVLHIIQKHVCFPFIFCLLCVLVNLLLTLSPFLSVHDTCVFMVKREEGKKEGASLL